MDAGLPCVIFFVITRGGMTLRWEMGAGSCPALLSEKTSVTPSLSVIPVPDTGILSVSWTLKWMPDYPV